MVSSFLTSLVSENQTSLPGDILLISIEGDSLYPICTPCASLEESQNVGSCNQGGLLAFDLKDVGDYPIESLYSESNTEQEPSNSIDGREDSSENPEFIEWTATGSCEPEPVMAMDELDEIWETWMSEHPERKFILNSSKARLTC